MYLTLGHTNILTIVDWYICKTNIQREKGDDDLENSMFEDPLLIEDPNVSILVFLKNLIWVDFISISHYFSQYFSLLGSVSRSKL